MASISPKLVVSSLVFEGDVSRDITIRVGLYNEENTA
jgi:hypothetical protein